MLRRTLRRLTDAPRPPPTYGEPAPYTPKGYHHGRQHIDSSVNAKVQRTMRRDNIKNKARIRGQAIYSTTAAVQHALESTTDARTLRMAQLSNQIFSKGVSFITSACNISFIPDGNPATPEIAFVGRSHVGKTALLRSLFKDRYAVGHSNTLKRKDAMSFFNVGDVFNVAECPGYGSRSCPFHLVLQHAALIRNFVRCRPSLKMLYYCMDVSLTHGLCAQDIDILKFLAQEAPNFTIVITKGDMLSNADQRNKTVESGGLTRLSPAEITSELQLNGIFHPMLVTSAYKMGGLDTLRFDMISNALHALPTEMLTYTEACKLSKRLLSQQEIASVRPLNLPPTERDDEERLWNREIAAEAIVNTQEAEKDAKDKKHHDVLLPATSSHSSSFSPNAEEEFFHDDETDSDDGLAAPRNNNSFLSEEERVALELEVDEALDLAKVDVSDIVVGKGQNNELATTSAESYEAVELAARKSELNDATIEQQRNFSSLTHKLENKDHLDFIRATSPWRNPLNWPSNVIPTRSLRHNIMRCPEDPTNPYLTQPRFVAPRMDMYFRRPSSKLIKNRTQDKGLYHADSSLAQLDRPYTIPYFPTISDVDITPKPQHMVGISNYFSASGEGRFEGQLALKQLQNERVNPLASTDSIADPRLRDEVAQLEAKRYHQAQTQLPAPDVKTLSLDENHTPPTPKSPRIAFLTPQE